MDVGTYTMVCSISEVCFGTLGRSLGVLYMQGLVMDVRGFDQVSYISGDGLWMLTGLLWLLLLVGSMLRRQGVYYGIFYQWGDYGTLGVLIRCFMIVGCV